jgi:hypothetical protein
MFMLKGTDIGLIRNFWQTRTKNNKLLNHATYRFEVFG